MPSLLISASTLPRWPSDPEPRFVIDLARHLPAGWEPLILAPAAPGAAAEELMDGVPVKRYGYAPVRQWQTLCYPGSTLGRIQEQPLRLGLVPGLLVGLRQAVAEALRSRPFDCVHAHWLVPQGLIHALAFPARHRPPLVVTSHGGDLGLAERSRWLGMAVRGVVRRSDALTVVAPGMRNALASLAPGLDPDSVPVISMGVDISRFHPGLRDGDWPRRHGLSPPVVLFVGRLVEKKGVAPLLDAFSRLRVPATLAIVGDGPQLGDLEERVSTLGLGDRVRFLGPLQHAELAIAYASSDVFCAPSMHAASGDLDGMPTVLPEAAASRLPLVGSDLAGLPLMIEHEYSGLLVPPGDADALAAALTRLLGDATLRSRLGAGALAKVQAFTWPHIAGRFVEVYEGAIERKRRRARDGSP